MANNRSKNSQKNIVSGVVLSGINMLLPFFVRTAIIYALGEQFAGLSSLFSSILQVLNLAELGFSSAVIYHMYKPIAEGNVATVNVLLNYYKKIYRLVGATIFVVGLLILPFITVFINGTWPDGINIYFLYFLYLLNTSVSYFLFAYMGSLLNAMQRLDIVNLVQIGLNMIKYMAQIVAVVIFKNFYLYVWCLIISSALTNILTALVAKKKYPEYRPVGQITSSLRKSVKRQVGGLMIGKLGDTSRNSFDSIIISSFLGLTAVAIYGNYYYIFSAIYAIILVITHGMQASVGDSIVKETREKNYKDLLSFQLLFSWMLCIICAGMICLYQPFMELWVGEDFLLPTVDVVMFVIYFYVLNINNARNLYFSGRGLWWNGKTTFLLEAGFNLLLNIGLGACLGITGVILATILTIFVFNFICRTNILFKEYFKCSPKEFYRKQARYSVMIILLCGACFAICGCLPITGLAGIIAKGMISIIFGMLFIIPFRKTSEFKKARKFIDVFLKFAKK